MKKRIFSLICALFMLGSIFMPAAAAEAEEFVKNGGFEILNADKTPAGWSYSPDKMSFSSSDFRPKEGNYNLKTDAAAAGIYASQKMTHVVGGSDYTLSFWTFLEKSGGAAPAYKLEFYDANGTLCGENYADLTDLINNRWKKTTISVKAPENAFSAVLLLRSFAKGDKLYWDEVSFKGARAEGYVDSELVVDDNANKLEGIPEWDGTDPEIIYSLADSKTREFVKNPSFETLNDTVGFQNWSTGMAENQTADRMSKENPHSGEYCYLLKASSGNGVYTSQKITGLMGNAEYKFSSFVKTKDLPNGLNPLVKIEYYGADDLGAEVHIGDKLVEFTSRKNDNNWEEWTFNFTAPAGTSYAWVALRVLGVGGEISFDDASVIGAHRLDYPEKVDPKTFPKSNYIEMPEGSRELITNGGLEEIDANGNAVNWNVMPKFSGTTDEKAHSGKYSAKVSSEEGNNPWIKYSVYDIEPLTEYQVSAWVSTPYYSGRGIAFKMEWYTDDVQDGSTYMGKVSTEVPFMTFVTGEEWYHYAQTMVAPEGAKSLMIYCRVYASGTAYFDELSLFAVKPPKPLSVDTNETFYYTEALKGKATAEVLVNSYPDLAQGTVDFALTYEGKIIDEKENAPVTDGISEYTFYMEDMTEKKKEYKITASVKDSAGNVLGTDETPVYKFDRPTAIQDDETILTNDGKRFDAIFAYHMPNTLPEEMKKLGINLVQIVYPTKEELDEAQRMGAYGFVCIYPNMKAAGNVVNIENTKKIVAELKDHPALFGWAVMDEPFANDPYIEPDLINSYKIIHEIDPVHPIWIMEDSNNYKGGAKYSDVLGVDPYPGTRAEDPTVSIFDHMKRVQEAAEYNGIIYHLLQAYKYNDYEPTIDEMRNMIYQSYFGRVKGIGYYAYDVSVEGKIIHDSYLFEPLVEWKEKEHQDMTDYFSYGEYPTFNIVRNDDFWAESFVKDGKIHMFVQSRKTNEEVNVNIPLTSYDGKVNIADFSAAEYCGADGKSFAGNGVLTVTLKPAQAVQYVISPSQAADFSSLKASKFGDMGEHIWAKEAVVNLEAAGIIEGIAAYAYGPGKAVTRGDFAAYLIRTLGLTAEVTDNFSDVRASEKYAKEVAIGKALGILQGVGDNTFRPEDKITRQDLMTIVARGMEAAGIISKDSAEDVLAKFSDAELLADYARNAVAAVVSEGIVLGNADGTVNPLGNATRAETAVIMNRLLNR